MHASLTKALSNAWEKLLKQGRYCKLGDLYKFVKGIDDSKCLSVSDVTDTFITFLQ
jgi:hypothetical protein